MKNQTVIATALSVPSVSHGWLEAFSRIDELDLLPISSILQRPFPSGKNWSSSKAAFAITEYRRFLKLNCKYIESRIVPSQMVDEVWHCHILDTRKYEADCKNIFGHFLHHYPYFGVLGDEEVRDAAFTVTSELYKIEFGSSDVCTVLAADNGAEGVQGAPACCDAGDIKAACCDAGDIKPACCDAGDIVPDERVWKKIEAVYSDTVDARTIS
jgi:hypothetical protein